MQKQEIEIVRLENNQEELIPGWIILFLPECVYFQEGPGLRKWQFGENGIPFLNIRTFNNGIIDKTKCQFVKQEEFDGKYNHFLLDEGDIVVSSSGTIGKVAIIRKNDLPLMLNTSVIRFRSLYPDNLLQEYLKYYLQSRHFFSQLGASITGSAISNYGPSHLKQMRILVPPTNEQRRIVAKLEKLLAKVDTCKERLDKIPGILKRFRQSVLSAACSGRLTADWRENNPDVEPGNILLQKIQKAHELAGGHKQGNAASPTEGVHNLTSSSFPNGWEIAELRDICEPGRPITYGILKPGAEILNGVPYIRVADFPNDRLKLEDIRRTSAEIDKAYARSRLITGDILLSIRGTVGRLCKIPPELNEANITQDSARLSIQSVVNSDYICWFLKAMPTQKRMQNAIKGVAIRGINIGDVRALQIALPPYEEQQEIVRRVETLFKTADRIEQRYQQAKSYIDQLTQSILAKAFRGELVPQDPNDEPASVLLERIRAERENRENVAKTAKKPAANKKQRSKKAQPQLEPTPQLEPIQLELPLFD